MFSADSLPSSVVSSWPPSEFPVEREVRAVVTYVDNGDDYSRLVFHMYRADAAPLMEELRDHATRAATAHGDGHPARPQDRFWHAGEPCLAWFWWDQYWYRGEVMRTTSSSSEEFDVRLVDYGSGMRVKPDAMRKDVPSVWSLLGRTPSQALRVELAGIVPPGSGARKKRWCPDDTLRIHQAVVGKWVRLTILDRQGEEEKTSPLLGKMVALADEGTKEIGSLANVLAFQRLANLAEDEEE